ncbi:hypothetical protein ACFW1A_22035 [Kitasatospora sp. NPDC058965]|uniref:hypothetical protein n=1 Tax=Kitasatospora sp. NPDC058965 TaxID=3346682 RepID=UPI00369D8CF4
MTTGNHPAGSPTYPIPDSLPTPEALLRETDWADPDLYMARGDVRSVPAALAALLDPDPTVQQRALDHDLEPLRHQNSIYPPAVYAAQYIAAILPDPRTATVGTYQLYQRHQRTQRPRPLRAALLDWLGFLAYDANDWNADFDRLHGYLHPERDAVRAMRPLLFGAVSPFLRDPEAEVRQAALVTAVPLAEDPRLTHHHPALSACACDLLDSPMTDRYYHARALEGLAVWNPED